MHRKSNVAYALDLRHLIVPLPDVCANEIENALEWRNQVLADVVLGVKLDVLILKQGFWAYATIN
jgi:hypothetical protein